MRPGRYRWDQGPSAEQLSGWFSTERHSLVDCLPSSRLSPWRVISGGQTGVDRAALDAAMERGIPVGGWCPKGRRACDGIIPNYYPLQETGSRDYSVRTAFNVRDSDGTLVLSARPLSGGTLLTEKFVISQKKPYQVVDSVNETRICSISDWLQNNDVHRLNIAGPREQNEPGIYGQAYSWLTRLFQIWPAIPACHDQIR